MDTGPQCLFAELKERLGLANDVSLNKQIWGRQLQLSKYKFTTAYKAKDDNKNRTKNDVTLSQRPSQNVALKLTETEHFQKRVGLQI